ncbi:4a-hydroxytetrahydrobiopterin dehydratase [Arthrobacter sp. NPDC056886]|uniref:4a-hydroxytetrahydrobiopterin dehydratase n=1 Tax=Arthrobacter sp. NPDC056886 TaxID=3345960 RepID=UPI00366F570F
MAATDDILTRPQIDEALAGLPDWRYRLGGLVTVYKAPTAAAALELIAAVGRLAEEQNHHPDLDWRYNRVFLRYSSHDAGTEVTPRDVQAAAAASVAAAAVGAAAEPGLHRTVDIAIDSEDPAGVSEVWRVALAYRKGRFGVLMDPHGRGPSLRFRETSTPSASRIHVDIHRSKAESGPVLEKTAATGALMNRDHAPDWVVVTDAQGNRLCLCTEEGHGPDVPA